MHDRVQETLAELRLRYWLIRGRQFVCKLIHGCTVCHKLERKHCEGTTPPPLPEYRVRQSRPFQTTGMDFAGPLHVRASDHAWTLKVWLCLYTCCATRAVHQDLDLVSDLTATTFMRSFRRFAARRGTPSRIISDNAKTFKSAAVNIRNTFKSPEAVKLFARFNIEWRFNLERAPWCMGRNIRTYDQVSEALLEEGCWKELSDP